MKRSARALNKKIEIWQTTNQSDGFGGNTKQVNQKITESFAKITTTNTNEGGDYGALGINDPSKAISIVMRKRNDIVINAINQFVIYAGIKYFISTEPIDVNFEHNMIKFIAVRDKSRNIPTLSPIT